MRKIKRFAVAAAMTATGFGKAAAYLFAGFTRLFYSTRSPGRSAR
jgi:hypothetical protein